MGWIGARGGGAGGGEGGARTWKSSGVLNSEAARSYSESALGESSPESFSDSLVNSCRCIDTEWAIQISEKTKDSLWMDHRTQDAELARNMHDKYMRQQILLKAQIDCQDGLHACSQTEGDKPQCLKHGTSASSGFLT